MRTVETKLYSIGELSESARKRAVDKHREFLREMGDTSRDVTEMLSQDLDFFGLPSDKLEWSLSCCQGDGVAFYGTVDVDKLRKALIALSNPERTPCPDMTETTGDEIKGLLTALLAVDLLRDAEDNPASLSLTIERNSYGNHYSHARTMDPDVEIWFPEDPKDSDKEAIDNAHCALENAFGEYVRAVSHYLETRGYSIIEYNESDENILEDCEASEYEYLEDGQIAPSCIVED